MGRSDRWNAWVERDVEQVKAHMDAVINDDRPTPPGGRLTRWIGMEDGSTLVEEHEGYGQSTSGS